MLMKNSYDTIGDLNGDLPACGVLPQLTAPPRAALSSSSYKIQTICNQSEKKKMDKS